MFFLVTLIVVDSIPDFVVQTYVSRHSVPVELLLFAYVFGAVVFGWYGIFLGPIIFVSFLHFVQSVFRRLLGGEISAG